MARRRKESAELVTLRPTRWPEFAITYRVPTLAEFSTAQEIAAKRAKEARKSGASVPSVNQVLLARQCVGIKFEGEAWTEANGDASTFASQKVLELTGVERAVDAVGVIYRGGNPGNSDGDLVASANKLVAAMGLDTEVLADEEIEDPTQGQ